MLLAHKKNVNTLGYAVNSLDPKNAPKSVDPTFMPYWNNFQPYAWYDANKKLEDGPKNSLCYLQLAGNTKRDPPVPSLYAYTGNLVRDEEMGTLMISKDLFWNKWLLPKLRVLNIASLMVATRAHCSNWETSPDWEFEWKWGRGVGRSDDDPFYDWKPADGGNFIEAALGDHWAFDDHSRADDSGGPGGSRLHCYIDCKYTNSQPNPIGYGEPWLTVGKRQREQQSRIQGRPKLLDGQRAY